jgi:acyl-CoA reductase-like NAD-dependent aldehyde dehydrogenase
VDGACFDALLGRLLAAVSGLAWGDPLLPDTRVGPLISEAAQLRVRAVVERARAAGHRVWTPPDPDGRAERLAAEGFYLAPAVVCCDDASHEIVQEESFGPVLVVQRADDFEHALALCNGVRQGLVAALFSPAPERRARFLAGAEAGILKLDASTAGASADAPFAGWKSSGVGPAEHGAGDLEFYTRPQAVYG